MASPYDVTVWVYDLSNGMAKSMSMMFLGRQIEAIYHTGVVVYGSEYFFGGGIAADKPGATQAGAPIRKVKLGTTNKTQEEFHQWLRSVGDQYTMETYNVMSHNCNNFAAACTQFLLGSQPVSKPFPQEILDLPRIVLSTPMGQMFKPMFESIGPNSQQNSQGGSFIPIAANHLALPTPTHNTPPNTAPTSPPPATPMSPSPEDKPIKFTDHRITSLTTADELPYHALNVVPEAFPTVQHGADQVTKMFALIKASYKNPGLADHLAGSAVTTAQETVEKTVTQLLTQMKTPTTVDKMLKQSDYIAALKSLQIISEPYDTPSMIGNLGLYSILLAQFNLETLLITQNSIETDKEDTKANILHNAAAPLFTTDVPAVTFDAFVTKVVTLYQTDILPQVLSPEPSAKFKPAVLKLLRSTFEQFFHVVLSTGLSPSSQLSILKLVGSIIDESWGKCTGIEVKEDDKSGVLPKFHEAHGQVLKYALQILLGYIVTLKTDNTSRPPKFFAARALKDGIVEVNKECSTHGICGEDNKAASIDAINDYLTDFYVTAVLKLQEVFTQTLAKVNLNILSGVEFVNYLLYIICYIANGTQAHCQLLLSLDFEEYATMHQWFDVVKATVGSAQAQEVKFDQVQILIKLIEDFDAVIVLGNRERPW